MVSAVAQMRSLAQELSYASGATIKKKGQVCKNVQVAVSGHSPLKRAKFRAHLLASIGGTLARWLRPHHRRQSCLSDVTRAPLPVSCAI